jgi:hypothetical protein
MWDSATKKQFRQALIEVYRNYRLLEIFVMDELGERLTEITHEQSLKVVAFDVIEWAESQRRLDELFAAFCRENPRHMLALQRPSSSPSPPPKPPPTSPPVLQEYRRDVVWAEPMVPPAPVNHGDSTVTSAPKQQPKEKPRSRETEQANPKPNAKPQSQTPSWWKWQGTISVVIAYTVTGIVLAFSGAPIVMWALPLALALAWTLARTLAFPLALAGAWALAGVEAWALVLVWALALPGTWALALAWDELMTVQHNGVLVFITLAVIAGLSLALGALLALPFDITIPTDWSWLR